MAGHALTESLVQIAASVRVAARCTASSRPRCPQLSLRRGGTGRRSSSGGMVSTRPHWSPGSTSRSMAKLCSRMQTRSPLMTRSGAPAAGEGRRGRRGWSSGRCARTCLAGSGLPRHQAARLQAGTAATVPGGAPIVAGRACSSSGFCPLQRSRLQGRPSVRCWMLGWLRRGSKQRERARALSRGDDRRCGSTATARRRCSRRIRGEVARREVERGPCFLAEAARRSIGGHSDAWQVPASTGVDRLGEFGIRFRSVRRWVVDV